MKSVFGRLGVIFWRPTALVLAAGMSASMALAADPPIIDSDTYVPGIWIDPDGCEHWVMDDGWEGFMSPHLTRDGRPVCHEIDTCAVLGSDQLFATNGYAIGPANRARLAEFFKNARAKAFIVTGHTDSRASEAYNQRLSERRAIAVANIAKSAGAKVFDVRGYGENTPRASNRTAAGKAANRRVEIICVH